MISKVLVANRGEIARRIFRTCREMGIGTVAVFSAPDAGEPHSVEADESVLLPGESAAETYLSIDAVMAAVKETGADAVHPGYGFLAENAAFARAVTGAGITWIGPSPEAIEVMGSKLESKRLMGDAGVPVLPGVPLDGSGDPEAEAERLGYPVLVKASAGGGGKGMRIVERREELAFAIEGAAREAGGAFGDDTLFLEKYLTEPRHVEIQVFGDSHGRIISLHERECSIQRRHQKIIEEAPSPVIDDERRSAMGQAAVAAAAAIGYAGAGTVEFLYQGGDFYFLEMNTRLQVEHPVTEMVTGLDLVRLQIEVATGGRVPEEAPPMQGHAIEARLYAEDPLNDYLPVTGTFHHFAFDPVDGLRVDSGISDGSTVSVHYDPMIAKVIAHASTREAAAGLLASSLRRAHIHGSTTNRALLVGVLEHPEFIAGHTDTHFLQRHDVAELGRPLLDDLGERVAAVTAALADQAEGRATARVLATIPSGWRNSPGALQHRSYQGDHGAHHVAYTLDRPFLLEGLGLVSPGEVSPGRVTLTVGDAGHEMAVARYGDLRYVDSVVGPARLLTLPRFPDREADDDTGSLHAPMPGKVIRVEVAEDDEVDDGDVLIVMEAMKMEHTLRAPHRGTVTKVLCAPGDQVEAGAVLVIVEES
ncbi:MAG TPA: biotin carboxylase N-terminal domain-containing protein [Acidimicrobiia bacterium]|nr:biotin carboxylase N-terminal domain-containing protein [Acidimicrobiia bacterium]